MERCNDGGSFVPADGPASRRWSVTPYLHATDIVEGQSRADGGCDRSPPTLRDSDYVTLHPDCSNGFSYQQLAANH